MQVTVKVWLDSATAQLQAKGISSARLDAEIILCDALSKDRTWLIAHQDNSFDPARADLSLMKRLERQPLAYIRGYKEFYGRNFRVTRDTLIPRPETETLIETVLSLPLVATPHIHDVGTGTGCIPITLGLELPHASVSGSDISHPALEIARANAEKLQATNVSFYRDDLLERTHDLYDVITANLPYVDTIWETSLETAYEPSLALYADDGGLELIKKLIEQAPAHLLPGGFLALEADPRQHADIAAYAKAHDLTHHNTKDFIVTFKKS